MFNTFHVAKPIPTDETEPDDFGEKLLSAIATACSASTPLVRRTAAKGQPWYNWKLEQMSEAIESLLKLKLRAANEEEKARLGGQLKGKNRAIIHLNTSN